jgi:hypothetical protein
MAGPRCDSLPYQSITAIDLSVSWTGGKIRFITANTADRIFTAQTASELRFKERDYAIFKAAKEKIDELMAMTRKKATQTSPGPSIPEQIKQLAELKDIGALTPQEFEAKKTELLNRL